MKIEKKILYLGLDPSRWMTSGVVTHLPLIVPIPYRHPTISTHFQRLPSFSAVLFTSRTAVSFYFDLTDEKRKQFYAVGQATGERLKEFGIEPLIAQKETGEGVCDLLSCHPPTSLFYPHAKGARQVIHRWLQHQKITHLTFPFYETVTVIPDPLPDLARFDQIIFTSPSTVEAFLTCYGKIPAGIEVIAIGPVTAAALERKGLFVQELQSPRAVSV